MKYLVYILLSLKDHKLYIGCTSNITNRLKAHSSGAVQITAKRRPFVLLYTEECADKSKAFNRERYYKSLWSARFKKKLKQDYFKNLG
jgi:putative endonuclease